MKKLFYILLLAFTCYSNAQDLKFWETLRSQQVANIVQPTGTPILTNFRVENSDDNLVYFDATEDITGLTTQGFTISDVIGIIGVTIDGDGLGGYFTIQVDVPGDEFDFWDNNTIRLEGGDGTVPDFALTYIQNNMVEPPATVYKYADVSSSGLADGSSESDASTLSYAFANAQAGETWWIKAGDYGDQTISFTADGTATSPIKFIGYATSINDIASNYYDYNTNGSTPDTSIMPTITGTNSTTDGIVFNDANYIILENFQVSRKSAGFYKSNGSSNVIIRNSNALNNHETSGSGGYGFVQFATGTLGNNNRLENCNALGSLGNFWYGNNTSLIKNCKSYGDTGSGDGFVNYYYSTEGDNNIYLNNYTKAVGDVDGGEHGFSMQTLNSSSHRYCLNEGMVVINMYKALEVRHDGVEYNVIRGLQTYGEGTGDFNTGSIRIRNEANYNIFENMHLQLGGTGGAAISFEDANESGTGLGTGNIIRNSIFEGAEYVVFASNDNAGTTTGDQVKIYNNVFVDANYMFFGGVGSAGFTNSEFKNNIITGVTNFTTGNAIGGSGWIYENNDFYNAGTWANTYIGSNGNVGDNPQLDVNFKPTASSPTSVTEGGQTLTDVLVDKDGKVRTVPYSMGAYEYGTGGTPPQSNPTYVFDGSNTDYFTTTLDMNTVSYQNVSLVVRAKINNIGNDWMSFLSIGTGDEFSYQYNNDMFSSLYSADLNFSSTNDEQYHTWIITSNGTTTTIYKDNVSVATGTANSSDYLMNSLLSIGTWNSSQYFDGEMTDVQVYDKVLTSTERGNLQTDITNIPSTNQVMILGATKSSTTWTDLSGNGNNATNAGGVTLIN